MNLKSLSFWSLNMIYKVATQISSLSGFCIQQVSFRNKSIEEKHKTAQKAMVFYEQVMFCFVSFFCSFLFFFSMHQKPKFLGISSSPSFVDVCWFWRAQTGVLITLLHDCAQGTQFKRKYLAGQSLVWKISSSLKGFMPFVTRCQVRVNIWQGEV